MGIKVKAILFPLFPVPELHQKIFTASTAPTADPKLSKIAYQSVFQQTASDTRFHSKSQ
ncbi:hypothetical protein NIES3974_00450 [Calothrix sp. NIES-3974]|nr:hypothetical protein NIES3974_00450 [Calothrix sp. NIES-3974]